MHCPEDGYPGYNVAQKAGFANRCSVRFPDCGHRAR